MKDKTNPTRALFEADDTTVSRISSICPADWEDDALFEQAYQKYQCKTVHPLPRIRHHDLSRIAVTAACLLVMAGGAGGMYYLKSVAPVPYSTIETESFKDETTTTPTETTVTETSITATSYTAVSAIRPDESQTVTVEEPSEPVTASIPEAPETSALPDVQTTAVPETTALSVQTVPVPTEAPVTEPVTEPATEPPPAIAGFTEESSGDFVNLRYSGGGEIPLESGSYALNCEGCTMQEMEVTGRFRRFSITKTDGTWYWYFTLDHFPYAEFTFDYRMSTCDVHNVQVNGRQGYLLLSGNVYMLIWDDGTGVSIISDSSGHSDSLLPIAEHFYQE